MARQTLEGLFQAISSIQEDMQGVVKTTGEIQRELSGMKVELGSATAALKGDGKGALPTRVSVNEEHIEDLEKKYTKIDEYRDDYWKLSQEVASIKNDVAQLKDEAKRAQSNRMAFWIAVIASGISLFGSILSAILSRG